MDLQLKTDVIKMWTCPECGRKFERHNQSHSCKLYPLKLHFEGKERSRKLYEIACKKIEQKIGAYKIESLECCIHLVSTFTFAAIKILKGKLQIDFSLSRPLSDKRISRSVKLSAHKFLYCVEVTKEEEIDAELINWIKEAHDRKSEKGE